MREVRRDNTPAKVGLVGRPGKFTPEENKEARRAVEAEGRFGESPAPCRTPARCPALP